MKKLMMIFAASAVTFSAWAVQCSAKTEDGAQCKREALEGRKLCWQHAKAAAQCQAVTAEGTKCKREATEGSKYCWQHAKSVGTCAAVTEDGKKCTRKTEPGQKFCWQHAGLKAPAKADAKKAEPAKKAATK